MVTVSDNIYRLVWIYKLQVEMLKKYTNGPHKNLNHITDNNSAQHSYSFVLFTLKRNYLQKLGKCLMCQISG